MLGQVFRFLFSLVFLTGLSSGALAQNVLYCKSELATGFMAENGIWREGSFVRERFTIKFNRTFTTMHGLDKQGRPPYRCSWAFREEKWGTLLCLSSYENGEAFLYNTEQKRFIFVSAGIGGYTMNGTDTDVFYAGTCTDF